jgi:hypothetical protein
LIGRAGVPTLSPFTPSVMPVKPPLTPMMLLPPLRKSRAMFLLLGVGG